MGTPNPGSKDAQDIGCICATIDNHYGEGMPSANGGKRFWITDGCPVHSPEETKQ